MAANQNDSSPLLLPIGHYGGAAGAGNGVPPGHEIRRGGEIIELPEATFAVWALCHRPPGRPADVPWTKVAMLDHARQAGLPTPDRILDELLKEELATEVRPGTAAARATAEELSLHPTMLGLGNSSQDAHVYSLGFVGVPVVQVSRTVFELWRWAPVEGNLWNLCRFFSDMERAHGASEPQRTDPGLVLEELLRALPTLVASGAVYLDLAE